MKYAVPEDGLLIKLAFRRANSCFCHSYIGTSDDVAARSSHRSSTSCNFSGGLRSNMEISFGFIVTSYKLPPTTRSNFLFRCSSNAPNRFKALSIFCLDIFIRIFRQRKGTPREQRCSFFQKQAKDNPRNIFCKLLLQPKNPDRKKGHLHTMQELSPYDF